eukprot:TRINITY_DN523_c0_g1_i1.p1 TRINITY_DN523_c0_g1~~TRINITY_DN523_c0_g1_i1.p1  ORF type:complete len:632 (-),score=246.12 TRINITY_DN523_c0_g1_i1:73-1842(-)
MLLSRCKAFVPHFRKTSPVASLFRRALSTEYERAVDTPDVVIVGGGPSGLSAAIRLKQLANEHNLNDFRVCLVDKASEVGAHILSGAVIETVSLNELIPNWKELDAPLRTQVTEDQFLFLTEKSSFKLPVIPQLDNHGKYIISLGQFCRWLSQQAEALGVEIYPGIAATEVLYDDEGRVKGIATNDMGIGRNGKKKDSFAPGMELHARTTIFAEGCRGSLTKTLFDKFDLRKDSQPQTYGLGLKELWRIDPAKHRPGFVQHTLGWPVDSKTYAGSFMYHLTGDSGEPLVSTGYVVGLDYQNPYMSPYYEFQTWKTHPSIRSTFEGGECLTYGARTISEGGLQSLPKLTFPGGALIGDCAGFLNVPKIKGTHAAMKSAMLCADATFDALKDDLTSGLVADDRKPREPKTYEKRFKGSWLHKELHEVRNFRPSFQYGMLFGLAFGALDTFLLRGRLPLTLKYNHHDHETLLPKEKATRIQYPKPDGKISFDLLTNLSRSNTYHEEDQPCHLKLKDRSVAVEHNLKIYDGPESRYCPAGVYEFVDDSATGQKKLQINQSNCIHCKTCDIKDPTQNINWVPPEGGGGPIYPAM